MTLRRQDIVVGVVIAAVVSVFLSPLFPVPTRLVGRHHSAITVAAPMSLALQPLAAESSGFILATTGTNPVRSGNLLELNCVRLC
jgi:hypothetical protein